MGFLLFQGLAWSSLTF